MEKFSVIHKRAIKRKGEAQLQELLAIELKKPAQLRRLGDDRYLSEITKAVFKAGFVWKVIDNKWPNFEKAFWKFNVRRCAVISPEDIDKLMQQTAIVRNLKKIQSVQRNAGALIDIANEYGSMGEMLASWPDEDFIGLTLKLNKTLDRMGIQTCQYFCRFVGKDGFVLSADVIEALKVAGIIDKAPGGKAAQQRVQAAFNQWREETGFGLAKLSRIMALSIDAPRHKT